MQPHDHSPLNDFIEYSEQSMLARSAEFLNAMQRRHSIRHFSDRPVDKAIIENCILTAGIAPSGAKALAFFCHPFSSCKKTNT